MPNLVPCVWLAGWLLASVAAAYLDDGENDDWFPVACLAALWPLILALAPLYGLLRAANWLGRRRRRAALERGAS